MEEGNVGPYVLCALTFRHQPHALASLHAWHDDVLTPHLPKPSEQAAQVVARLFQLLDPDVQVTQRLGKRLGHALADLAAGPVMGD